MFTHSDQAEKRPPVPAGEIDRTPEIYSLFAAERLSGRVASALLGHGRCRTIGKACRMGRRWMLSLPGIGAAGMAEIEALAAELGLEVRP
jgi:hypothetical protein